MKQQGELKRGAWSKEEDEILTNSVNLYGAAKWRKIANISGLKRCGKSCRLRWINYLRSDIKRGDITADEEDLIIRLHRLLGNRWSLIAGRLPGRTDNEIKNYWNTTLMKKLNQTRSSSSTSSNHNRKIMKSKDKAQKIREGEDNPKARADDNDDVVALVKIDPDDKMVRNPNSLPVSPKQDGGELETNKDGAIFGSSENNFDFLADIGEIKCGFSSVDPVAQGSIMWEDDDAKLVDVEMMKYNGDGDLTLLDIELKKLASFLDLDDDQEEDI